MDARSLLLNLEGLQCQIQQEDLLDLLRRPRRRYLDREP